MADQTTTPEAPSAPPPVRTILQAFYSANCAACTPELQVLAQVMENPAVDLVIIVMGDRDKGYAALKSVAPRLVEVATAANPREEKDMLLAAGSPTGRLPYARSILSTGVVCQTWSNGLTTGVLDRMLESCRLKVEELPGKAPESN